MNEHDKILFEFCGDIKYIISTQDSYAGLKKLTDDAASIIANKQYSNINIQDVNGNTFLHYILREGQFDWAHKLISLGANPLIKNNDGTTGIRMIRFYDGPAQFLAPYEKIATPLEFTKKTKNFALPFKEFILNNLRTRTYFFEDNAEIVDFLTQNDLNNDFNLTHLIMSNLTFQDFKDTIKAFFSLVSPNCPASNSLFLKNILTISRAYEYTPATTIVSLNKSFKDNSFFARPIAHDNNFNESIYMAIEAVDFDRRTTKYQPFHDFVLSSLFNYATAHNYDFFSTTGEDNRDLSFRNLNIKDLLEKRPKSKIIFEKTLLDNSIKKIEEPLSLKSPATLNSPNSLNTKKSPRKVSKV